MAGLESLCFEPVGESTEVLRVARVVRRRARARVRPVEGSTSIFGEATIVDLVGTTVLMAKDRL